MIKFINNYSYYSINLLAEPNKACRLIHYYFITLQFFDL